MSFTSHPEKKSCFKNGKEYFKLKKKDFIFIEKNSKATHKSFHVK